MKGKLALCSRGFLGLITEDEPQPVVYSDGTNGVAYVGVHLSNGENHEIGDQWSSRTPKVVGELAPILFYLATQQ